MSDITVITLKTFVQENHCNKIYFFYILLESNYLLLMILLKRILSLFYVISSKIFSNMFKNMIDL